jgi:hypothetical protein
VHRSVQFCATGAVFIVMQYLNVRLFKTTVDGSAAYSNHGWTCAQSFAVLVCWNTNVFIMRLVSRCKIENLCGCA